MYADHTTSIVRELAKEAANLAYTMDVDLAAHQTWVIEAFVEGDTKRPMWMPGPFDMLSLGYVQCLMDLHMEMEYESTYWQELRERIAEAYYAAEVA